MYTAILYIPRGYRVDTETVIVAIERIGQFDSVQAAEKAAQSRLDRLALPEHLQKHAHYRTEQVSPKIRPLQAAYRKKTHARRAQMRAKPHCPNQGAIDQRSAAMKAAQSFFKPCPICGCWFCQCKPTDHLKPVQGVMQ